jgi:hypothetical protein
MSNSIKPQHMSLFPTMGSLQEVVDYAKGQLPITNDNMLTTILMVYHNTILSELKKENPHA